MKVVWFLKRLDEKLTELMRYLRLKIIFNPKGFVRVLGKVYLTNPNIKFGKNVTLYPNVHIFGQGSVLIGDNVTLGDGTVICAAKNVEIGKDSMVAAQCYIIDCNHGMHLEGGSMRKQPLSISPTKIGENVWIGCGCKILPGSEISDGSVIGAGTVISGMVKQNTICFAKREYNYKERI